MSADEEVDDIMVLCCASCGKAEVDDVKLKKCAMQPREILQRQLSEKSSSKAQKGM